jgi:hypothetical protein
MPPKKLYDSQMTVPVAGIDKTILQVYADRNGIRLSQVARDAISEYIKKLTASDPTLVTEANEKEFGLTSDVLALGASAR